MKISEIKNEAALDMLADIIEPLSEIYGDEKVREYAKKGKRAKAISSAIKGHKKDVIAVVAALDGATPDKYEFDVITLFQKALEIMNDPELQDFFISQEQMAAQESSGSATETTTETAKRSKTSSGTRKRDTQSK